MTASLSCEVDGQLLTVDLSAVSGLDAIEYRVATGEELDLRLGVLIFSGRDVDGFTLADRSILRWLWTRQNGDPTVSLAHVAAQVPFLPSSGDESPPEAPTGAPVPTPHPSPAPVAGVVDAPEVAV